KTFPEVIATRVHVRWLIGSKRPFRLSLSLWARRDRARACLLLAGRRRRGAPAPRDSIRRDITGLVTDYSLGKPAAFAGRTVAPNFAARARTVVGEQNEGNAAHRLGHGGIADSVCHGTASGKHGQRRSGSAGRRQRGAGAASGADCRRERD